MICTRCNEDTWTVEKEILSALEVAIKIGICPRIVRLDPSFMDIFVKELRRNVVWSDAPKGNDTIVYHSEYGTVTIEEGTVVKGAMVEVQGEG